MSSKPTFFREVYDLVKKIPVGKVATYGQIATLLGNPRAARTVGWALHALKAPTDVPWHRVINSRGEISLFDSQDSENLQQKLLEAENITFDDKGKIDLKKYQFPFPISSK